MIELHDIVNVKMIKHRMYIQLTMCMRNAFLNNSLMIVERDLI